MDAECPMASAFRAWYSALMPFSAACRAEKQLKLIDTLIYAVFYDLKWGDG